MKFSNVVVVEVFMLDKQQIKISEIKRDTRMNACVVASVIAVDELRLVGKIVAASL